jgi:hypothetical protein
MKSGESIHGSLISDEENIELRKHLLGINEVLNQDELKINIREVKLKIHDFNILLDKTLREGMKIIIRLPRTIEVDLKMEGEI